jgi:DNA-binding transcriptional ArsR family regulator
MKDGPNVARIAALLGDPARADVLTALMTDRALTATELAGIAGVTKQTMSAHLTKLLDAALVAVNQQGRHRYFRLADRDVAELLESLMGVAFRTGAVRLVSSPREPALRKSRVCYDHLAGELAVTAYETLLRRKILEPSPDGLQLTARGAAWAASVAIDTTMPAGTRRYLCRPCMDWSERRHHLAGTLGAALFARVCAAGWAKRATGSRVVAFTAAGERAFVALLNTSGGVEDARVGQSETARTLGRNRRRANSSAHGSHPRQRSQR